jgi:hypothetical protein
MANLVGIVRIGLWTTTPDGGGGDHDDGEVGDVGGAEPLLASCRCPR